MSTSSRGASLTREEEKCFTLYNVDGALMPEESPEGQRMGMGHSEGLGQICAAFCAVCQQPSWVAQGLLPNTCKVERVPANKQEPGLTLRATVCRMCPLVRGASCRGEEGTWPQTSGEVFWRRIRLSNKKLPFYPSSLILFLFLSSFFVFCLSLSLTRSYTEAHKYTGVGINNLNKNNHSLFSKTNKMLDYCFVFVLV